MGADEPADGDGLIRVVLADDQATIRESLEIMLDLVPDLQVVGSAADGEQVIELAARLQPDVILMDLHMPGIDGVEATRRILGEHSAVRIVVLTTYADDESVLGALRAGAIGYLTKDAGRAQIAQAVRTAAAGQSVLDPAVAQRLVTAAAGRPQPVERPVGLTPREAEVLRLIAAGRSNAAIADELVLSPATVKTHINNLFAKLGVRDRAQAVRFAYEQGLTESTRDR